MSECERRMQQDLREMIARKLADGWDVVSRDPLTLGRVGCKQRYRLNATGFLVTA